MSSCSNCKYFKDFTDFNLGMRCFNTKNSPSQGDFLLIESDTYHCEYYSLFRMEDMFEWDENKNEKNKAKHKIGFEKATELYNGPYILQSVEKKEKWEKIDEIDFEEKGIEKNTGNLDPIRAKITGIVDGKVYTFVYTFRHEIGDMKYRIISLRRADKNETELYFKSYLEQRKLRFSVGKS